ncbi:MAG: NAD(P)-dependent oxidoreductase [Bacteroidota bacterium]|jgi:nucleoside-diphosphate-sugar epimerase
MRILITGVNGFVGNYLFNFLNIGENNVYGVFRNGNPLNEKCFKVDLTDAEQTNYLFEVTLKDKIDIVIHTAAIVAQNNNLHDFSLVIENSKMALNISNSSKKSNLKQIINFSSSSVYPNVDGDFSECSEINPSKNSDCLYGLSKWNSEIIFEYFFLNTSTKILHLRIGMIYGNGMNTSRIIPVMENELISKNTITLFADGERYINQISVQELCNFVNLFAIREEKGIFNVATEYISTKEIANKIIKDKGNSESKLIFLSNGLKNKFKLDATKLKNWINA